MKTLFNLRQKHRPPTGWDWAEFPRTVAVPRPSFWRQRAFLVLNPRLWVVCAGGIGLGCAAVLGYLVLRSLCSCARETPPGGAPVEIVEPGMLREEP
jgi:hypothetical protein